MQHTTEFQNDEKQFNFFHTTVTNNGTDWYDLKMFRKLAITNVLKKPNSNMAPNISVAVFKGFLSRVYKTCSKRHVDEEFQFLIGAFTGNGYKRKTLEKISKSYWIRGDMKYLSVFGPNARKYGPEKTPYLDTFRVMNDTISLVLYLYANSKVVSC